MVRFDSAVRLEPFNETIGLKGVVEEGRKLQLAVRIGNKPIQTPKEIQLPSDALLSECPFAPDGRPGLRLNQTWTVPVYSPFMPDKPLEIIHANVERLEPYTWNGTTENVWYVVYRGDAGMPMGGEPLDQGRGLGPARRRGVAAEGDAVRRPAAVRPHDRRRGQEAGGTGGTAMVELGQRPAGKEL